MVEFPTATVGHCITSCLRFATNGWDREEKNGKKKERIIGKRWGGGKKIRVTREEDEIREQNEKELRDLCHGGEGWL